MSTLTCLNCNDFRSITAPNYIYIYLLPLSVTVSKTTLKFSLNQFSQEIIINEINCSNCNVTENHSQLSNINHTSQYLYI